MTITFKSDASIAGRGFKANYSFVDSVCGGVLKTLGTQIKPPLDSDLSYAPSSLCKWVIVAPIGYLVQLSFSTFEIETHPSCRFDSVMLYDGTEAGGAEIGKFCGSTIPPVTVSSGNVLSIVFSSDYSFSYEGFLANYNFIEAKNCMNFDLF